MSVYYSACAKFDSLGQKLCIFVEKTVTNETVWQIKSSSKENVFLCVIGNTQDKDNHYNFRQSHSSNIVVCVATSDVTCEDSLSGPAVDTS